MTLPVELGKGKFYSSSYILFLKINHTRTLLSIFCGKKGKGQRRPRSDKHGSTTTTMTPLVESAAAPATTSPAAHVEFVNPRFKEEFLSTDNGVGNGVADAETTHAKDNPWVWLNAYSRIPVSSPCSTVHSPPLGPYLAPYLVRKRPYNQGNPMSWKIVLN